MIAAPYVKYQGCHFVSYSRSLRFFNLKVDMHCILFEDDHELISENTKLDFLASCILKRHLQGTMARAPTNIFFFAASILLEY